MNTEIITEEGERWDGLSQRAYGVPWLSAGIMQANTGVMYDDRLPGGVRLVVPVVDIQRRSVVTGVGNGKVPPWKR